MPGGLFTDFYELTMAAGYHREGLADEPAVFDLFFRDVPDAVDLVVVAGLEPVVEYLTDWDFSDEEVAYLRSLDRFEPSFLERLGALTFTGNVYGIAEGTPVFPNEPVLRVEAPLIQAQLVETALINRIAHSSLITSHAAQIVASARGKQVLEFGARRAHGPNGALTGTRAAMIGGCASTSLTEAGQHFGAPVSGTQAHSWVMAFDEELASFRAYARTFPDASVLLVDTYDTLASGVPNAITVGRELRERGHELSGIRLDSGDLAELAFGARRQLDEAGFGDVKIFASGDLNAERITAIEDAGAPIDAYGVGTELATAKPDPSFTAVYKLAQIGGRATIKLSSSPGKTTDPGVKQVWRTADCDVIGLVDEDIDGQPLLDRVIADGRRLHEPVTLPEMAGHCHDQRAKLREQDWPVRRSAQLEALREELLERHSTDVGEGRESGGT